MPRVSPNINNGLQVIIMCQGRFTDCKKLAGLVGHVDNGESL